MGEVLPVARGTFAFASESFRTIEALQLLYAQCQDIFPFHAGSVADPAPGDGARSRSMDASDVVNGGPEKASHLQRVRVCECSPSSLSLPPPSGYTAQPSRVPLGTCRRRAWRVE